MEKSQGSRKHIEIFSTIRGALLNFRNGATVSIFIIKLICILCLGFKCINPKYFHRYNLHNLISSPLIFINEGNM
jgi:hypothetical protein